MCLLTRKNVNDVFYKNRRAAIIRKIKICQRLLFAYNTVYKADIKGIFFQIKGIVMRKHRLIGNIVADIYP